MSINGYHPELRQPHRPASGTIRARAKFANADGALRPRHVRVGAPGRRRRAQRAAGAATARVGFDQSKKFVYVVDADNKVELSRGRARQAGRSRARGAEAALKPGDRVIVDGMQHRAARTTSVAATGSRAETSRRRRILPKTNGSSHPTARHARTRLHRHEPLPVLHRPADLRRRDLGR